MSGFRNLQHIFFLDAQPWDVPKFMPTSGCLSSGQLKNFPHLPLFHHDPPNVGGPLEKEKALHTSHLQSGMSGKVCVMTPWPCDEVKSIPFKSASHFARTLPRSRCAWLHCSGGLGRRRSITIGGTCHCPKWIESRNLCFKRSDSAVLKKQQRILQKCTECTDQMRRARCRSKGGQVHNVLWQEKDSAC